MALPGWDSITAQMAAAGASSGAIAQYERFLADAPSRSWQRMAAAMATGNPLAIASASFQQFSQPGSEAPPMALNGFENGGSGGTDWGATILGLGRAALDYRLARQQVAQVSGPLALPGGLPTMNGDVMHTMGTLPTLGRGAMSLLPTLMRGAAGLVRTAAGKIRGVILAGGRFISTKKGVALAKRVGIDAAAAALGIGAIEMAQMVLDDTQVRGRRRGISAANLRTTRRTITTIERMHRQLVSMCGSARVPRRAGRRK